ncbi:hypothetical protein K402DRAFT_420602 [Aulographum hederae CBS 113979]|uniref:Rhodopsin domain-containing protein n=1 Tax=Aulographum hederae CBS 113979 TaxID=1176131 RepID=A0A6G1H1K5_9PEZI|nr:hypothetical protein K402DRAFT_420602 [Aulographum hederae CBS 113979]
MEPLRPPDMALEGPSSLVLIWILFGLAWTLVATRLWFRIMFQGRKLTWSDGFLMASALAILGEATCLTVEYHLGSLGPYGILVGDHESRKAAYASVIFYDLGVYFPKLSILAFYYGLFPPAVPRLRMTLHCLTVYICASFIVVIMLALCWCGADISENWNPTQIPPKCTIFNKTLFNVDWAFNISSDVYIFALPWPIILRLKLTRQQIVALVVTFSLGIITMGVSIGRFTATQGFAANTLYAWSMAENTTAIIVVSLPALKPLLRHAGQQTLGTRPGGRSNFNSTRPFDDGASAFDRRISMSRMNNVKRTLQLESDNLPKSAPESIKSNKSGGSKTSKTSNKSNRSGKSSIRVRISSTLMNAFSQAGRLSALIPDPRGSRNLEDLVTAANLEELRNLENDVGAFNDGKIFRIDEIPRASSSTLSRLSTESPARPFTGDGRSLTGGSVSGLSGATVAVPTKTWV